MIGIVIGMLAVMGVIATGVMGVLLTLPGAMPVIVAVAAAYFVYLAFRIATAPPVREGTERRRQPSFAGGLFLALVLAAAGLRSRGRAGCLC